MSKYIVGWLDTSIHDFLEILLLSDVKYALITCLDSDPNPASLLNKSPELKPLVKSAEVLGNGILLPTKLLLESNRIFFGFDEVWFFLTKKPKLTPKRSIVGPGEIRYIGEVEKWMMKNNCILGLGDGTGMNFIVYREVKWIF